MLPRRGTSLLQTTRERPSTILSRQTHLLRRSRRIFQLDLRQRPFKRQIPGETLI
jgi:hypothetical protein